MSQKYADHEGVFEDKGEFSWNKSGKTVTFSNLKDKTTMHFNVGENKITMLNEEGKKIKGVLANNYILTKVDPGLRGKKWKLSELSGKEIEGQQEAFILLDATSNSVSGNLNCNNFTGNYELKPDNHIQFSNLVVTQKMCLKMEIEDGLKKMLESADSYSVTEEKLILICARKALIAAFVPAE
jgi:heat shock protein HslJ